MPAKQLLFEHEARAALKRGVQKIAMAVKSTLGPRGRAVILDKGWGAPQTSFDGASVAEEIELQDPYENMGAQMIKEAASKTNDAAGDGTTTSAVLAEAMFLEGLKTVIAGANSMAVSRGIRKAADAVADELKKIAVPLTVNDREQLVHLAQVASKGDQGVGVMLADAFQKVGKDGAISVEEGKGIETEVKIVGGMQFDRGFLSPHFVTHPESVEAILENCLILIIEDKLSSVTKLIPLLEKASAQKAPLLVIAEDVEGEVLATLVVNRLRGILPCCAVKAPGYGDRRRAILEDIAILTGGRALFKDLGIELDKVTLNMLGRVRKVVVDADNTTLIEGGGDPKAVQARVESIRKEWQKSTSDYDREKLQERLSKLAGGVAQILVGAATETEMKQRKQSVEDALHAVRAALEEGTVPGGGVAYLRCAEVLKSVKAVGDEAIGVQIVARALETPLRQMVDNAGGAGSLIVRRVKQETGAFGYDVEKGEYGDLRRAGIIDPLKVVRTALLNAASVAALLITSEALISEIPEKKETPAAPDMDDPE